MPYSRARRKGAAIRAKARREPGNRRDDAKPDAASAWLAARTASARREAEKLAEKQLNRSDDAGG
jgi:hypothetical protein